MRRGIGVPDPSVREHAPRHRGMGD